MGCDGCLKWRKVPIGFQFDRNASFFCNMIEMLTCDMLEEEWDDEEFVADHIIDDRSDDHRYNSCSTTQEGGVRGMSRLDAVVCVLKATGKAQHYNITTCKALQQGLIRSTGKMSTVGDSMKSCLNKTIRQNKTAGIVNLGRGVYGLKVDSLVIQTHTHTGVRTRAHTCTRERHFMFHAHMKENL